MNEQEEAAPEKTAARTFGRKFLEFYDNGINWAIVAGMVGLVVSILLFAKGDSIYGELALVKQPLLDQVLTERLSRLDKILYNEKTKQKIANDSNEIQRIIDNTKIEKQLVDHGNTDTSLNYFNKYVVVNRGIYAAQIDSGKWITDSTGTYKAIQVQLMDTCKLCSVLDHEHPAVLKLISHRRKQSIDFFKEYPQFGSWLVFGIIQMVLWFMIIPFLVGLVKKVNQSLGHTLYKITLLDVLMNSVLPILFVSLFCWLFYEMLLNRWLITNDYFLTSFKGNMWFCCSIGYFTACMCFGTHISIVRKLRDICKETLKTPNPILTKNIYSSFKSAFDNSFLCSALILSFCVLWTGIMVNAVNGLEVFRFYTLLSGKNFIPNDFVYLQGLLHTLILLIFYIPAKFKFNNLTTEYCSSGESNDIGLKSKTVFAALADSMGPIFITVSPLLASIIHSLLNLITKN